MSIKAMTHVWDFSEHSGSRLLLMLALADHADDKGVCWPGIESLSHKIRMSNKYTKMLMQSLIESGELRIIGHGGYGRRNTNRYQIVLGEACLPLKKNKGDAGLPLPASPKTDLRGRRASSKGEAGLPRTVNNHQEQESLTVNDSSAAAGLENEPEAAAAAASENGWAWGMFDISKSKLSEINRTDACPGAFISHYFRAACNPRAKSAAAIAVRSTLDNPNGAQQPWAALGAMTPEQLAADLLALRDGGPTTSGMGEVRRIVNGRHGELADRALHDLGLYGLAQQLAASQASAQAAAPVHVPETPQELDAWERILACTDPAYGRSFARYRHMFEGSRLIEQRGDVLVVEISSDAYHYLHSGGGARRRMDSMFGSTNFEWRIKS